MSSFYIANSRYSRGMRHNRIVRFIAIASVSWICTSIIHVDLSLEGGGHGPTSSSPSSSFRFFLTLALTFQTRTAPSRLRRIKQQQQQTTTNVFDLYRSSSSSRILLSSSSSSINEELRLRMAKLKSSERMEEILSSKSLSSPNAKLSPDSDDQVNVQKFIELPVICFDALLPHQHLEGRTQDPTFSRFLRSIGVGGFFVMTSIQPKSRMVRRNAVICKVIAVDAKLQKTNTDDKDGDDKTFLDIPTAVDFEILGHSTCRIVDSAAAATPAAIDDDGNSMLDTSRMKQRIGRWRRMYDPNGEESCLGWGEERFVDLTTELSKRKKDVLPAQEEERNGKETISRPLLPTEWSSCWVEIHLEPVYDDHDDNAEKDIETTTMLDTLRRDIDRWIDLASDPSTYENVDVTASVRILKGQPGLYVDPRKLLKNVQGRLGPRPSYELVHRVDCTRIVDPTKFLLWAAALINPIPPLGVAPEIRGAILEAPTVRQKIEVLKVGLIRSIRNLEGKQPL